MIKKIDNLNKISKYKNKSLFLVGSFIYLFLDLNYVVECSNENNRYNYTNSLDYEKLKLLLKNKNIIIENQMKKYLNISTPFNRKIKYIYDLSFFYPEYENYNFNKLSDFFLNVHIFIN